LLGEEKRNLAYLTGGTKSKIVQRDTGLELGSNPFSKETGVKGSSNTSKNTKKHLYKGPVGKWKAILPQRLESYILRFGWVGALPYGPSLFPNR